MLKLRWVATGFLCLLAPSVVAKPVCVLVVDAQSGATLAREGAQCETRNSPASTFKLALALLGYDAGVLIDAHRPAFPYREDYAARRESWKQTHDPESWMRESVVWYSQQLTAQLGMARFQQGVDRLDYGNRDLSGDPGRNNGLSAAWLGSSLTISPVEQVAFLRKLLDRKLAFSAETIERTLAIVPRYAATGWTVHGKTGAGVRHEPGESADAPRQFGWFVGWAEKDGRKAVFAELLKDDDAIAEPAGFRARDDLLASLPRLLAGP